MKMDRRGLGVVGVVIIVVVVLVVLGLVSFNSNVFSSPAQPNTGVFPPGQVGNVTCYNDEDCPSDPPFCDGNQSCVTDYRCKNPGRPNSRCVVSGGGCLVCEFGCSGGVCKDPPVNRTHLECVNEACVSVSGGGANLCSSSGDCVVGNETKADLWIKTIQAFVGNQTNGTTYNVSIQTRVENIGEGPAGSSTTRVNVFGSLSQDIITGTLNPGQSRTLTTYHLVAIGNRTVRADADFFNVIQESNENNNRRELVFSVP